MPSPDKDQPPAGATVQQANAWCLVHKAALDAGLLSFLDRLDSTGAERTAAFIGHLAGLAKKRVPLFQLGDFVLRSGQQSAWKIEADALTDADWAALAKMASEILPPFGSVSGVPRGGLPFAKAMERYVTTGPHLICEDVVTTGGSMERYRHDLSLLPSQVIGIAVFARGIVPNWVKALFEMPVKPT